MGKSLKRAKYIHNNFKVLYETTHFYHRRFYIPSTYYSGSLSLRMPTPDIAHSFFIKLVTNYKYITFYYIVFMIDNVK